MTYGEHVRRPLALKPLYMFSIREKVKKERERRRILVPSNNTAGSPKKEGDRAIRRRRPSGSVDCWVASNFARQQSRETSTSSSPEVPVKKAWRNGKGRGGGEGAFPTRWVQRMGGDFKAKE